jgi:ABC-type transporter Mla maintaining outer membrane lipid asymmetry ATPase subunit MlaF
MSGERISQALARIEAAAARIAAADRPSAGADPALAARHEALREAVKQTLHDMDELIGKGQGA